MRAVNLVPAEARRVGPSTAQLPTYLVLGALTLAVIFVTIYVLSTNTISDRKAKLATLQTQVAQAQAEANRLGNYTQFAKLAQAREQTVQQIAQTRFDWHAALADLSKVVPANTSLQSLTGSVVPGASAGGATGSAGAGARGLRGDLPGPAFELQGCTGSQDDVARLMSRLRVINNVTRVTLSQSEKSDTTQGAAVGTSTGGSQGCGSNKPSFDILVFFAQVPGAGPNGPSSVQASTSGGSGVLTPSGATAAAGGAK